MLTTDDLVTYRSLINTTDSTNGGYISNNVSVSGIKNNLFLDVSENERLAGSAIWRKIFWKNTNSLNLALRNVKAFMSSYTPGDDWVVFCAGTHSDTQATIINTTRFYGAAKLKTSISIGTAVLVCTLENADMNIFNTTDTICIRNGTTSEVFNNVTINKAGLDITITLAGIDGITNNYNNADTIISSVLTTDDLATAYTNLVNASTSGVLNTSEYDIELFNVGTIFQEWTIRFYSATQFTLHGNTVGYAGDGNINIDFTPSNPSNTSLYFLLYKEIWQGTWNINDEVRFTTLPAAIALWFKRYVPVGSSSTYNNFKHIIRGQATTQ